MAKFEELSTVMQIGFCGAYMGAAIGMVALAVLAITWSSVALYFSIYSVIGGGLFLLGCALTEVIISIKQFLREKKTNEGN
jgi:hypothetical protein